MKKLITILVTAAIITTAGCSGNNQSETTSQNTDDIEEGTYTDVDVPEAQKLINQGITVVDVRTPEEYAEGHIPNALLIPLQDIESRMNEILPEEHYLIVCRSGNRSAQASGILAKKGMKHIYNMTGGMNEWTGEVETE